VQPPALSGAAKVAAKIMGFEEAYGIEQNRFGV
jgi:hypothetical protein